ncbi:C3 and PZP-like alpha-2-macroglobulin domain-containing protein 8 isoform X2 [Corticium candelabrum]|uniref:C3 and PZP-like alpha-2-macroglobulin domain-containing protein 8 isoform X2 n=1 Tax=Corticium candelabrum TaxID=121492 RepID=UPI002E25D55B|nr:C3 and PZP-like alpha-2-macroglobulin domain-containing protein 8 isoform X2 [Corticium candelabrum]
MGRYSNLTLDYGVADFDFPISSEPVLGTHRVCSTYEGSRERQQSCLTFEVKRYDEVLSCPIRTVCFSISAKYTYGQRVEGTISALVVPSFTRNQCLRRQIMRKKIYGQTSMCVDVCSNGYFCGGDAVIEVNITDSSSDTTVQCKGQTRVPIKYFPYKLTIMDDNYSFHPCHAIVLKVAASTGSGKPIMVNVSLDVSWDEKNKQSCKANRRRSLDRQYRPTDTRGIATFSVCMPCNALSVSFYASAVTETYETNPFSRAYSIRSFIYSPGRIVLSSKKKKLQIGESANITASFSIAAMADYYVVYDGNIVDHGRCLPKSDRKASKKHKQLCKTGGIRRTCYISFAVMLSMAPRFTLIVSQKGLAASWIAFEVIQSRDSAISVQFQHKKVKPGEKTNLLIKAPPMSYVGVVAVDQSVYIQQDKNQLTTSKLDQYFQFDYEGVDKVGADKYVCDWSVYWDCRCTCYGPYPRPTGQAEGDVHTTNFPTVEVDSSASISDQSGNNRDLRRPIRDVGRNKRQELHIPPGIVYPVAPKRNISERCCPRNCTAVHYPKKYCWYYKASINLLLSGIQLSDSETAPMACQKPNLPPKPNVTYDCCEAMIVMYFPGITLEGERYPEVVHNIPTDESDDVVSPSRVRTHFPETWLWFARKIRNNTLHEEVTVPDTITSWVADAFAVSPSHSMSIASPATLTVFKPFFITINLPYSVIRGELVEITITVYNYLETRLTAFVDVHVDKNDARLVREKRYKSVLNQQTRILELLPGYGKLMSYLLLPLRNGHLPIRATARSTLGADSLVRNLLVEPEGVKEEHCQSSLLCLEDDENYTSNLRGNDTNHTITYVFNASLPPNFVPDSESAVISVTANYMGPTIEGLENLLRLPTGCGEQNMLNFAPAVYIARYLDTVGQLDEVTRKKALLFMQTGYQREMTYQREDGSYSAFGNSDRCGSMWLTAFVLRSFGQADGLIGMSIDERVQNKAVQFIKNNQNADGSFPSICSPIHKEMQGCSGGNCSLTAYVTLALLEAGIAPKDETIRLALYYLSKRCVSFNCNSPYNLALIAFTLSRAVGYDEETDKALKTLQKCAVKVGDHTHWQYSIDKTCHNPWPWSYYCRTRSCDVEATAYASLAFIDRGNIAYSLQIVRWLIKQRNPRGGFKSTQDTMVALQALSEYAKLTVSDGRVVARVSLNANQLTETLSLDPSNAMQVQTITLTSLPTLVNVTANGRGCILASVGVKYNVPKPDETAAFHVFARAQIQRGACKYLVRVCNRWIQNNPDTSNMAISEITFFSGFLPIQSELKQLVKSNRCNIKRTEFKGRALNIYFEEVTQMQCCFEVTMKRASVVADLQGVPVITYNYYEPDERGGTMMYPRQECL